MGFISIILRSLIVFTVQFFTALVGGSGNGGLSFAPLPDADAEMWAGDLFLIILFFGVAGLPAQGLSLLQDVPQNILLKVEAEAGTSASQSAIAPGKRCIIAPCDQGRGYSESGFYCLVSRFGSFVASYISTASSA